MPGPLSPSFFSWYYAKEGPTHILAGGLQSLCVKSALLGRSTDGLQKQVLVRNVPIC